MRPNPQEIYMYEASPNGNFAASLALLFVAAIYAYCASMLIFFPPPVTHEFIYFQF
jgi:hypothetical protein